MKGDMQYKLKRSCFLYFKECYYWSSSVENVSAATGMLWKDMLYRKQSQLPVSLGLVCCSVYVFLFLIMNCSDYFDASSEYRHGWMPMWVCTWFT